MGNFVRRFAYDSTKERDAKAGKRGARFVVVTTKEGPGRSHLREFEGGAALTIYHVTLRDRETQTVVGYYDGAWTTDRRRALALRRREAAEAHAARLRDRCPRNADVINVEEAAAAD